MRELDYNIVRSPKRKKLTITVERDRAVVVRAPQSLSDDDVRRVVDAKRQWILEKQRSPQKYENRLHPPGKEVVSGESALFLGRDYRIEIAETESGDVEFENLFRVPPSRKTKPREVLRNWYVVQAKEKILSRAQQYARELGVEFTKARIVDNRYRWGSCTARDSISFNWRLIKAPIFVIDYVIVHELAHLIQPNHSPDFWNIVRAKAPAMEKAKTWLKEHGQVLEDEI
jgi:predicted metal-dependent hydrolase